jgi:hypothetical protein
MPVCRSCQRQLATCEVRLLPKGPLCKDVTACAAARAKTKETTTA